MTMHRASVPTLTEVIDIERDARDSGFGPVALAPESLPIDSRSALPTDLGEALTAEVLETLRPRIDALLETRLQAAIAPQLARLTDEVVQSLRGELASVMHRLVAQAVEDLLRRRRRP